MSAMEGTFTVTCTAKGGTVLHSSLTGPGVNYTLKLVGTKNMRGDDAYSVTTRTIAGGAHGDTFKCTAINGAAFELSDNGEPMDPSDSESLAGIYTQRMPIVSLPDLSQLPLQLPVPQ